MRPRPPGAVAAAKMARMIVGREEELASVEAFVEEVPEAPVALVLEGEAGIGKSTLWLAGVEQGQQCGARVLSARPVEALERRAGPRKRLHSPPACRQK